MSHHDTGDDTGVPAWPTLAGFDGTDLRLARLTLADRIFEQLREQIIAGRVVAGETIPSEQEIGEAFGVGRTTVREALHGLVSSGFVVRRGRALVVKDPNTIDPITLDLAVFSSRSSIHHLYAARRLLEVETARLAAQHRTTADLDELRRCLELLDTDDAERYHGADPEFHAAIARASGNPVLAQMFLAAQGVFFKRPAFWRVFRARSTPRGGIGSGLEGHRELFDAIVAQDVDRAGRLMSEHLERVEHGLVDLLGATSADTDSSERSLGSSLGS